MDMNIDKIDTYFTMNRPKNNLKYIEINVKKYVYLL